MEDKLYAILPEEISDEAAYYLTNFVSELSLMLDSIYFAQIRRYSQEKKLSKEISVNKS